MRRVALGFMCIAALCGVGVAEARAGGTTIVSYWSPGLRITHIAPGHWGRSDGRDRHVRSLDSSDRALVAYPRAQGNRLAFPISAVDQGGALCPGATWRYASVGGRLAMIKHCDRP